MREHIELMIVAGEASGDAHAAKLVKEIRSAFGGRDLEFFGAAGAAMRSAGVEAIVESDHFSVVGIPEILRSARMFIGAYRKLKREAIRRKPDAVILVDFPDFNLRLARSLKKAGIKVIYYISPQLWAWRRHRIRTIRKYVDLMITILPFEKDWYAQNGVTRVEYVGSPLAREVHSETTKAELCARHGLDPERPLIALLPGSRHKEIVRILPVMLRAAADIDRKRPGVQFIIALADVRRTGEVHAATAALTANGHPLPKDLRSVTGETYDILKGSDAAAVTSGTATLETGILGTPMAIVYKTSAINYKTLRPLINVEHFGLINLIAGERAAKELIQDDFTPETLSAELLRLIEPETNARMRVRLAEVADMLGHGGASRRAAEAILRELKVTV